MAEIKQKEENKINRTLIEWVKNPDGTQGYTLNSKTGCLNGCPYCYARKLANGRLRGRYLANYNLAPLAGNLTGLLLDYPQFNDPFYPRRWPERLDDLRTWTPAYLMPPRGIFLDDMSDWMADYWPREWTEDELQAMRDCPQHRFYTLTKQPQNLIKFSPFPENCWVGVTVTNEGITYPDMMEEACRALAEIKATVKYLSFEPLLSSIYKLDLLKIWGIKWVIIGAQTKPYKPPKIEWVEEIVRAADTAGVKVFLKDNLRPLLDNHSCPSWAFEKPQSWEIHRRLRQEVPE